MMEAPLTQAPGCSQATTASGALWRSAEGEGWGSLEQRVLPRLGESRIFEKGGDQRDKNLARACENRAGSLRKFGNGLEAKNT